MNIEEALSQAKLYIHENQKAQARAILMEILRAVPENEEVWILSAQMSDKPEQVLYCLQRALKINPNSVQVHTMIGKLQKPQTPAVSTHLLQPVPKPESKTEPRSHLSPAESGLSVSSNIRGAIPESHMENSIKTTSQKEENLQGQSSEADSDGGKEAAIIGSIIGLILGAVAGYFVSPQWCRTFLFNTSCSRPSFSEAFAANSDISKAVLVYIIGGALLGAGMLSTVFSNLAKTLTPTTKAISTSNVKEESDMSTNICPSCNHNNPIGVPFCLKCAKLL